MKPILKYVGGKARLLPELTKRMPKKYGRYFEPFFGGGALFFHVAPEIATIADSNLALVHMYRGVVSRTDDVIALLKRHQAQHHAYLGYYNDVRAAWNRGDYKGLGQHAAAFIYLNKTCFNGLWRVNLDGKFNVPKGAYKNPKICDEKNLLLAAEMLDCKQFTSGDFRETSSYAMRGDFLYFDPPYVPVSKTSDFTAYTEGGFGEVEQYALADHARTLVRRGANVMLSNSDVPLVHELYKDFHIDIVECGRAINSKGDKRGKVKEVIITSYSNGVT